MRRLVLITGIALLVGCASSKTDRKSDRPVGVPADSTFLGFSNVVIGRDLYSPDRFETTRIGTMYVASTRTGNQLWSGQMNEKDVMRFDAAYDSIRINDTYVFTGRIDNDTKFAVYFKEDR